MRTGVAPHRARKPFSAIRRFHDERLIIPTLAASTKRP